MSNSIDHAETLTHLYARDGRHDLIVSYVGGGWYQTVDKRGGIPTKSRRVQIKRTITTIARRLEVAR